MLGQPDRAGLADIRGQDSDPLECLDRVHDPKLHQVREGLDLVFIGPFEAQCLAVARVHEGGAISADIHRPRSVADDDLGRVVKVTVGLDLAEVVEHHRDRDDAVGKAGRVDGWVRVCHGDSVWLAPYRDRAKSQAFFAKKQPALQRPARPHCCGWLRARTANTTKAMMAEVQPASAISTAAIMALWWRT